MLRPALILALLAAPALAVDYSPRIQKPEWRYVDEADEEEAAEALEKLLKKHSGERKAKRLLDKMREGRRYVGGLDGRKTLSRTCEDGLEREFTWYLPSRYSPRRPAGVLIWLHGAISQPAPGGGAHEARDIGKTVDELGFIKIGPSTYGRHEWGEPAVRKHVRYALDCVKQRFNVDENRIYVAGDSDGGRGAFALVETEATHYAAAIPTIGAPGGVTRFANLRNVPFLAINGAKDTLFAIDRVRRSVEAMREIGTDLTLRVVEDAGHDPFLFVKRGDEVRKFIEGHVRNPLPDVVDWQVDEKMRDAASRTFRWIRIEECGATRSGTRFGDLGGLARPGLSRVRAKKGEGNRVEVETENVRSFTVLVHDGMFDLDSEIEVVVNGETKFRERVVTDARAVLEEARLLNDRHLLVNARITIEVDGPAVK